MLEIIDEEKEESNNRSGLRKSAKNEFSDLQAGHTSRTAGMIYGRDLMESPFHTMSQRQGFRRVSIKWHRFLQFSSAWEGEDDEIRSRF